MNPLQRIEQEVLVAGQAWTRLKLQRRLQDQCDGMAMECPDSGQALKSTRRRELNLDTVAGGVKLWARYGHCVKQDRWICPARVTCVQRRLLFPAGNNNRRCTVVDQKLLGFPIVVDGEQGIALIGAEDQLTGGRQGCRAGGFRRRMAIRSGGLNRNHWLCRCDQRGWHRSDKPWKQVATFIV